MDDQVERAKAQAEYDRLHRAMNEGPGRRMVADLLANRNVTRADSDQAARYQGIMAALVKDHGCTHRSQARAMDVPPVVEAVEAG